jgi:hypothetical protein
VAKSERRAVDLSADPDLVMICREQRVDSLEGLRTTFKLLPPIKNEAGFMRGGMEVIYDTIDRSAGFGALAAVQPARGPLFSARMRVRLEAEPAVPDTVAEDGLYRT